MAVPVDKKVGLRYIAVALRDFLEEFGLLVAQVDVEQVSKGSDERNENEFLLK